MKIIQHWLDGKAAEGTSGRHGAVTNPATGAQTAQVAFADVSEVDAAVASAAKATAPT